MISGRYSYPRAYRLAIKNTCTGDIAVRLTALPTVQCFRRRTPIVLLSNKRIWFGVTATATVQ